MSIKAIAGINNLDVSSVMMLTRAAMQAGVAAIDVAANATVLRAVLAEAKGHVSVFASGVTASALLEAEALGADYVELGNFDGIYERGHFITAEEVHTILDEFAQAWKREAKLCVTIPGHLHRDAQVKLAQYAEAMGASLIQTEGATRQLNIEATVSHTASTKFEITLENTRTLAQAVRIPVMSATGVTLENMPQAYQAGAAWVGVGRSVNTLGSSEAMVAMLSAMQTQARTLGLAA
ncbi:MAG: DUF561 domain-containing protein [Vampirovibrionales bacterium]